MGKIDFPTSGLWNAGWETIVRGTVGSIQKNIGNLELVDRSIIRVLRFQATLIG